MKKYLFILFFIPYNLFGQGFYSQNCNNYKGYGYLYNWYAVNTGNLAPTGWHVPTDAEWTTLSSYLGGEPYAGGKLKEAGISHWAYPNAGATNESGFDAYPSGYRYASFDHINYYGYFWSSSEDYINTASVFYLMYYLPNFDFVMVNEKIGSSIRVMRTTDPGTSTITDYDGNIYHIVLIGTQYWTVENLKTTHLNDGTPIPNVTDNTAWSTLTTPAWCVYNNNPFNK